MRGHAWNFQAGEWCGEYRKCSEADWTT